MKVMYSRVSTLAVDKLVIQSIEQALYQAFVLIDGHEHLVWQSDKQPLRTRSLLQMREHFQSMAIPSVVLRQESFYDEMIGQPIRSQSNRMEVPLDIIPFSPTLQ